MTTYQVDLSGSDRASGGVWRGVNTSPVRAALGERAWARLSKPVQQRFSAPPAGAATETFSGVMSVVHANLAGRVLAWLLRLFGTPLAPHVGKQVPVVVTVEHAPDGSARWSRRYHFAGRTPLTVASVKCLDPCGQLVEVLPCGLRMQLDVSVRAGSLDFDSTGYVLEWPVLRGTVRLRLPSWLGPGHTRVVHRPAGPHRFRFTLTVQHPLLGRLIHQDGYFQETGA